MSLLAAIDFSENSRYALRHACQEALRRDDTLVVMHCLGLSPEREGLWRWLAGRGTDREELRRRARERLESFVASVCPDRETLPELALHVSEGRAPDEIVDRAEKAEHELVVLGATGTGRVERALLGSTTEEIVARSASPVLVAPDTAPNAPYERILAPVDRSACARLGLEHAVALAERDEAELLVLHEAALSSSGLGGPELAPSSKVLDSYRRRVGDEIDEAIASLDIDRTRCETLIRIHSYEQRTPAEAIVETARTREVDLVVMGTHGRRGMKRVFLGSTAHRVLRKMPTPVLTVRARAEEEA